MKYFDIATKKAEELKNKNEIFILAIETSCDETSAAIVKNGRKVLSNKVASQVDLHQKYGGVVPEIASRKHLETVNILIKEALEEAGLTFDDIDAIGVTCGPGLVGALLVGVSTAKALAYALSLPLVGVNHIEGHISANYISHPSLEPPFLSLIVSGGHSHLVWVKDHGEYEVMGRTRDDAPGEVFDKVARALGLGYPGGPLIDKLSRHGNAHSVKFPRAYISDESLDFSFSGLKTAVINYIHNMRQRGECFDINDILASFQQAVVDVLVDKTIAGAVKKETDKIVLAGGVAANTALRYFMEKNARRYGIKVYYPPCGLCTDNAAMIGCAAYYNLLKGKISDLTLNAYPDLAL